MTLYPDHRGHVILRTPDNWRWCATCARMLDGPAAAPVTHPEVLVAEVVDELPPVLPLRAWAGHRGRGYDVELDDNNGGVEVLSPDEAMVLAAQLVDAAVRNERQAKRWERILAAVRHARRSPND